MVCVGELVTVVVVVGSLHPNQPGCEVVSFQSREENAKKRTVLQVLVVLVERVVVTVVVVVVDPGAVVDSSRQPHQPGVLQVDVRVRTDEVVDVVDVVVVSEPLLSKNFQL